MMRDCAVQLDATANTGSMIVLCNLLRRQYDSAVHLAATAIPVELNVQMINLPGEGMAKENAIGNEN